VAVAVAKSRVLDIRSLLLLRMNRFLFDTHAHSPTTSTSDTLTTTAAATPATNNMPNINISDPANFRDPSNMKEPSKLDIDTAWLSTDKNVGTIKLMTGTAKKMLLEVRVNSSTKQHVVIGMNGKDTLVSGSGQNKQLTLFELHGKTGFIEATFSYGDDKSALKPVKRLTAGGPWADGPRRNMVFVTENGDDGDNNDAILELRGNVPFGPIDGKLYLRTD